MRLIAVVVGVLFLGLVGVALFADLFLRPDDSNLLVGLGLLVSVGVGVSGFLLVRWGARRPR